jgi:hypothetical protein
MQAALEVSLDLNWDYWERFFPSLLPRWLYEMQDFGLIPADRRKSIKLVLNLVWPVLKSFPTMNPSVFIVKTPGTNVFCGDPLINEAPSNSEAIANTVEAEISLWLSSSPFMRFSKLS